MSTSERVSLLEDGVYRRLLLLCASSGSDSEEKEDHEG